MAIISHSKDYFGYLLFVTIAIFQMQFIFLAKELLTITLPQHISPYSYYGIAAILSISVFVYGRRIPYHTLTPLLRRLIYIINISMLIYLVVEPNDFIAVYEEKQILADVIKHIDYIAILICLAAFKYPSLLLFPALHIIAARYFSESISSIGATYHDIMYISDSAIYAVSGLIVYKAFNKHFKDRKVLFEQSVAFAIIGLHLGNYFWSGIAKLALDGSLFEWPIYNDISQMFLVGIYKGMAPLGIHPTLAQTSFDVLQFIRLPGNIFVLALQLFCVAAVLRITWLRIATLLFDAFHVAVWLISGILFWPWIMLNFGVLYAFSGYRQQDILHIPRLIAIAAVIASGIFVGNATRLGWYDVADTRIVNLEAQVKGSNEWIMVPYAFLGAHAYQASHNKLDPLEYTGHYPFTATGLAYTAADRRHNKTCKMPSEPERLPTAETKERLYTVLNALIQGRHEAIVGPDNIWGKYAYYFRLHHHTSLPPYHRDFHQLDLNDITRYRVATRSLCLTMVDGMIKPNIIREDFRMFELAQ